MLNYRLRLSTSADYAELSTLFSRVFGQDRTLDEWHWKFMASRELLPDRDLPDSLVAVDEQGAIVGHAGVVILPGWFQGAAIPIVQVCDVMVHPDHRGGLGRGNLFTLMLRELLDQVVNLLPDAFGYGFPGERPYRLGEWAGVYARLETAREGEVQPARGWVDLWHAAPVSWYDQRLDRLWTRQRRGYRLCLVRDGAYLRWRYADNPGRSYSLIGIHGLGRLMGWAVAYRDSDSLRFVDVLAPRWAVRPMLRAAARQLVSEREGPGIRLWLPQGWRESGIGSWRETPVVTAHMCWRSRLDTETVRESLYYTMGDVDIF
jgi:hypothetical protein